MIKVKSGSSILIFYIKEKLEDSFITDVGFIRVINKHACVYV